MDNKTFLKAVKSLLSDIRSMQAPEPNWFGYFSMGHDQFDNELNKIAIEWPNLAIQAAEVQELIDEHEKILFIDHQETIPKTFGSMDDMCGITNIMRGSSAK